MLDPKFSNYIMKSTKGVMLDFDFQLEANKNHRAPRWEAWLLDFRARGCALCSGPIWIMAAINCTGLMFRWRILVWQIKNLHAGHPRSLSPICDLFLPCAFFLFWSLVSSIFPCEVRGRTRARGKVFSRQAGAVHSGPHGPSESYSMWGPRVALEPMLAICHTNWYDLLFVGRAWIPYS